MKNQYLTEKLLIPWLTGFASMILLSDTKNALLRQRFHSYICSYVRKFVFGKLRLKKLLNLSFKKKKEFCFSASVWWPIVAKFNLNQRRNFKPSLNFIFGMKIKSMFTFQIEIRNQIDLHFYLNIIFHLLSRFIDQVWFN